MSNPAQCLPFPTLVIPVPEFVCGLGDFHIKFSHWHAPGRHLRGKHGSRINQGGSSHLQSKQMENRQMTTLCKKKHFFQKISHKPRQVCGCRCGGKTKLDEINGEDLRDKSGVRRRLFGWSLELRKMCYEKEDCANGESGNKMTHHLWG